MADLSVRGVAGRAQTSATGRRWIAEGKLTATRTADGWTVHDADLTAMLDGCPSPDDGHSESVRPQNGHVDGRPPSRPSAVIEAQLLADTQAELVRTAAAAACGRLARNTCRTNSSAHYQHRIEAGFRRFRACSRPPKGLGGDDGIVPVSCDHLHQMFVGGTIVVAVRRYTPIQSL